MRSGLVAALLVLGGCATVEKAPPAASAPLEDRTQALLNSLKGHYSNYSQIAMSTGRSEDITTDMDADPNQVMDLYVGKLTDVNVEARVVSRVFRASRVRQTRLWKFDPLDEGKVALRIAILGEEHQMAGPGQLLELTYEDFDENCVLTLAPEGEFLAGRTDHERCRFDHPMLGDTGVFRQVKIGTERVIIDEFLLTPDNEPVEEPVRFEFDRHRAFRVWANLRLPGPDGTAGEWRQSTVAAVGDNGAKVPLLDSESEPLGFSVQLAKLEWRPGEPYFLRLAVFQDATGLMSVYKWASADAEQLQFESDWLQVFVEDYEDQASE